MAKTHVEAGLLTDTKGALLEVKYVLLRENDVEPWTIEIGCLAEDGIHAKIFHLPFGVAKAEVDLDLYPELGALLEEMGKRIEARHRSLRRLAEGNFAVDWSVASGREYSPDGKDFGGLWQSTDGQRQYFVHGVRGIGPTFSADECREKVQEHARKLLDEFERLVAEGKVEAALKLAASL